MASCKFCGKWAGWFKSVHNECAAQDAAAREEAAKADAAKREAAAEKLAKVKALLSSAPEGAVSAEELRALIAQIARDDSDLVWHAFCDWITGLGTGEQLPSQREETVASDLIKLYGFAAANVPNAGWEKFVRLCALRDLNEGTLPFRVRVDGEIPFNLELGESIVWLFAHSEYYEDKVTRSPRYGYAGLSVRVAPGVYAHGGQAAPPPATEGFLLVDSGTLALTDRAVLFRGQHRALRFKYKDIASFTRYDYGFAICKGTQTARQIGFVTKDVLPGFPDLLLRGLCEHEKQNGLTPIRRTRRPDEVTG